MDDPVVHIEVFPLQGADLSDPQAACQADVDPEILEREVGLDIFQDLPVVVHRQDTQFFLVLLGRIAHIPFHIIAPTVFGSETDNHLQNNQDILDGFLAKSRLHFLDSELLDIIFPYFGPVSEIRENMILQNQDIGGIGRQLDESFLVLFPGICDFCNCLSLCNHSIIC